MIRGTTQIQKKPSALNGTCVNTICLFPVTVEIRWRLLKIISFKPQLGSAFYTVLLKIRTNHLLSEN